MLFNTNENSISQQVLINKKNIDANTKAIDALGDLDTEAIANLTADVVSLKSTTTKNTEDIDSLTNIVNEDTVQITANTSALTKALTMTSDTGTVSLSSTAIYDLLKKRKADGYTFFNLSVNMKVNGKMYIMTSGLIDLLNLDLESDYIFIGVSTSEGSVKYWANIGVGLIADWFDGVYYNRVSTTSVNTYPPNEIPMNYDIIYLKSGGAI